MVKLPTEIYYKIFIQLDLRQQLICSLVCRNWWNALNKCSFFCNVTLNGDDKDYFNLIMDMFAQLPDRAARVEELNLTLQTGFIFNRRALLTVFPNAETIKIEARVPNLTSRPCYFTEPIEMAHAKPKVKHLADFYQCDLVSQMLHYNLGSVLESLHLDFRWLEGTPAVLSELKDLPLLKKLSLLSPIIRLNDLENIHTNIPSVQHFALDEINLEPGGMPFNIVPATCITKLDICISDVGDAGTHIQLYQYMTKKYINITDIEYSDCGLFDYYPSDRSEIYIDGIFDFFRLIGPNKSELTISNLPDGVDAFEILDSVDAQIKELRLSVCDDETVFNYLSQSQQSKYIEQMAIVDTGIYSAHALKTLPKLTSLSIQSREFPPPLYLVSCLDICSSTLQHLHIQCCYLVVAPFNTQLDSIQTLDISFARFTKDLGDIISSCFPNLVDLTLKGSVGENLHLALKNPYFQKATLLIGSIMAHKKYTYGFSFKAPNLTESQYYICNTKDATRVQHGDLQDMPVLSIETFTEKKLKVDCDIKIMPC